MVVQILLCQHCGSDRIVRNGRAPNGKQRFLCHTCGRPCRQNPSPRGYSEAEREQILRAHQERSSLRGLQRTFGVAPATVAKWLKNSPKAAASEHHRGRTAAGQRGPTRA
jgi:transposase-like protein